jgi:anti-sigma regulatory factor (Ser/Thr protein kinase)
MDIEQFISAHIGEHGSVTPGQIQKHVGFSRVHIHRVTTRLVREGKIVRLGATRNLRFVAPSTTLQAAIGARPLSFSRKVRLAGLAEDTVFREISQKTNVFELIPLNVLDILRYAFTEMLNNAIDHSGAEFAVVEGSRTSELIELEIRDTGIGLLENFRSHFDLQDEREALLEVIKGKITTRTDKHTGLGLFFTSRAVDVFILESSTLRLTKDNKIDDTFIESKRKSKGTTVRFSLATDSSRTLREVFDQFSSVDDGFFGTEYLVKLAGYDDAFISRSQAKMIMHGMERFKHVTLDFDSVRLVGQGFADETLRVWKSEHPSTTVSWVNANPDVEFMMQRSLST